MSGGENSAVAYLRRALAESGGCGGLLCGLVSSEAQTCGPEATGHLALASQ